MTPDAAAPPTALTPADALPSIDLRLIAVDMDGTLLDANGAVPDDLWPLLDDLHDRGIAFAPASGRQYATLRRDFDSHADGMVFIAENGALVMRDGVELSADLLERDIVAEVVRLVRTIDADAGLVLCGKRGAYIERSDAAFRTEAHRYYAALEVVDDLLAVDDEIVKLAVFDFAGADASAFPALAHLRATHQVVVSGECWVDVLNVGVNKGHALTRLQQTLGVTAEQTVAFGDYLNDLELMDAAAHSFAMANAHPDIVARARYVAPSNRDHGVITVLRSILDRLGA
ncbi:MAG: HAD family hydrolase [Microbacterium sp. SCN 71-21]|uniref:Cof-type HAD-IIB family hydrolase n=1 Tax=Microbacterium sp. SCN 71-21 TaxID=1660116 RepID=UPI00086AB954|nr:Cof-type HAD-IIB family hydrolase [Microbacterium sp. SCN 71-21]ODU78066.1 MAG: HAD family hydrolase [Microbacterium sp. SCN 71-21]